MVCSAEGAALFGSLRHGRPVARDSLHDGVLFVLARRSRGRVRQRPETRTKCRSSPSRSARLISPSTDDETAFVICHLVDSTD